MSLIVGKTSCDVNIDYKNDFLLPKMMPLRFLKGRCAFNEFFRNIPKVSITYLIAICSIHKTRIDTQLQHRSPWRAVTHDL
jgi:hypothetical protein